MLVAFPKAPWLRLLRSFTPRERDVVAVGGRNGTNVSLQETGCFRTALQVKTTPSVTTFPTTVTRAKRTQSWGHWESSGRPQRTLFRLCSSQRGSCDGLLLRIPKPRRWLSSVTQ